ncbi:MAG: GTPase [Solirubrobacterales bacterium]
MSDPTQESGFREGTDLDAAVAAAVAEGLRMVDGLAERVTGALDGARTAGMDAGADHGDRRGNDVITAFTQLLTEKKTEAEDRFARQRTRLETFNVVLFGRTGTGKSSLIEALSSGNGRPISPQGESDWTTDVRDVRWRTSRLVDTPGIGGWGRTVARVELEARAEAAVADADVVILSFDSQSQQAGEFSKIAEWVSRYGKPVVAVLNSRNPRWRAPTKVGHGSARRNLSRTVHEHVGNIRDELTKVGLPAVPIVAIHAKRAAFARTGDPYVGPDADSRQKQRDQHGPDRLLEWSNLAALELLLSEALAQHAAPLRLGMLHEQARALLADTATAVRTERDQAAALAEQLERGIADVLTLVGLPRYKDLAKEVGRLEKLRGGGFGAAGPSELLRLARHRLAAGLCSSRMEALRRAERLIEEAFEEREDLGPAAFDEQVLAPAKEEAEAVARTVAGELQAYLSQRLELVADDLRADLHAAVRAFGGTDARAGRTARAIGLALQTGSGLASFGSGGVLLGVALFNSWNPGGWIIAAVAVGGMVVSVVGGRLRRRAISARTYALSDARSKGRRSVHDTFDELERIISDDLGRILSDAAHARLTDDVASASALRRVTMAAANAARDLQKACKRLPTVSDASHLLSDIAIDLQRRHHPSEPTADRLLWLGESWCTDPAGLIDTELAASTGSVGHDPVVLDRLLAQIRSVTEPAALVPAAGSGADWVGLTLNLLTGDEDALAALAPVAGLGDGAVPRIVVAGDYSTGKSSFIKRLLVDSQLELSEQLEVAAQPKTAAADVFQWGSWQLVDTPGFQSTHAAHSDVAHEALIGASIVIILFNPNLVVGAADDLLAVLLGDPVGGRAAKLRRSLFIVNRSDELGIDPCENPAGYQKLCRRKELELAQALGAVGARTSGGHGDISPERILCVASDPYGMVGDRDDVSRADYDQYRDWDGMDALHRGLTDAFVDLGRNGVDVRILEGSAATLGDLIAQRRRHLVDLEAAITQRRRLLLDLEACLSAGRALQAVARDRLVTAYVSFVAKLFDDLGATDDKDELAARVERLAAWARDPELQQTYREWARRFARDQEEWQEATTARIEARLTSAAFASVFPDPDATLHVDHLEQEEPVIRTAAAHGVKRLAKLAAKASRETVTNIAHAFGHKFRPWGATKLTTKVNFAGGAFGLAFGALELYGTWRSVQKEGEAERTAGEWRSADLSRVREAAEAFFDSAEADAPGVPMTESLDHVQRARDDEARRLDDAVAEANTLAAAIDVCDTQMRDALERLEPTRS